MAFFDESYYLQAKLKQLAAKGENDAEGKPYTEATLKTAIADAGLTSESHYKAFGSTENLNPNAYFNESEYLQAKLAQLESVGETAPNGQPFTLETLKIAIDAAGLSPAEHYEQFGSKETTKEGHLLNPSNAFDANAYVSAKLVELQKIDPANWADKNPADVAKAIADAGLSPVSHYEGHGAKEAGAAGVAMVQTVPAAQRVANDPVRVTLGEIVPGNYNQPSAAPAVATAKPVVKPADMGGLAPTTISPTVVSPEKPLPVKNDPGYVAPPDNLEDTNDKPVIPPSTTTGTGPNAGFIVVDKATGTGTVFKPNGDVQGTVDVEVKGDGTVTPPKADAPVIDKDGGNTNDKPTDDGGKPIEPSNPGGGGGGGGGGGNGDSGGDSGDADTTDIITANYDANAKTLTIDAKTNLPADKYVDFLATMNADSTVDITVDYEGKNYTLATPVNGPCAGIEKIEIIRSTSFNRGVVDTSELAAGVNSITGADEVIVLTLDALKTDARSVTLVNTAPINIIDSTFNSDFSPDSLALTEGGTVTLGTTSSTLLPSWLSSETGDMTVTLGANYSNDFWYAASEGKDTIDASALQAGHELNISGIHNIKADDSIVAGAGGARLYFIPDNSNFNTKIHFDFSDITLTNVNSIMIGNSGGRLNSPTLTLGANVTASSTRLDVAAGDTHTVTIETTKCTANMLIGTSGAHLADAPLASTVSTGSGDDILIGSNNGPSKLDAGAGNDILSGGLGANELTGGAGDDTFCMGQTLKDAQTITDFVSGEDSIQLFSSLFGGGKGALTAGTFLSGVGIASATSADVRFMYNTSNGNLYYDADGNASTSGAVHVATLTGKPTLAYTDITLVDKLSIEDPLTSNTINLNSVLAGSAANDHFKLSEASRLTGNGGDDLYEFTGLTAPTGYSTISDFDKGDSIKFTSDIIKVNKGVIANEWDIPDNASAGDYYMSSYDGWAEGESTTIYICEGKGGTSENEYAMYTCITLVGVTAASVVVDVTNDTITVN